MRPTRRRLSEADRAVWAGFAAELRPLPGRERVLPPPAVAAVTMAPAAPALLPRPPAIAAARMLTVGQAPAGLDRGSWRRLAAGSMRAERRLDLHGMTVQRAFDRFVAVLQASAADGVRCIEVITGRGAEGGGVLRRELPLWLNRGDLRPFILAATHPHRRNDGSVLLLLRRPTR